LFRVHYFGGAQVHHNPTPCRQKGCRIVQVKILSHDFDVVLVRRVVVRVEHVGFVRETTADVVQPLLQSRDVVLHLALHLDGWLHKVVYSLTNGSCVSLWRLHLRFACLVL